MQILKKPLNDIIQAPAQGFFGRFNVSVEGYFNFDTSEDAKARQELEEFYEWLTEERAERIVNISRAFHAQA